MKTGWTMEVTADGRRMGPTDIGEAQDVDYDTESDHELTMRIVERLFMGDVGPLPDGEGIDNPPNGFTYVFDITAVAPDGKRYGFEVERVIEEETFDTEGDGTRNLVVYAAGRVGLPAGVGERMCGAFRAALRKRLKRRGRPHRLVPKGVE